MLLTLLCNLLLIVPHVIFISTFGDAAFRESVFKVTNITQDEGNKLLLVSSTKKSTKTILACITFGISLTDFGEIIPPLHLVYHTESCDCHVINGTFPHIINSTADESTSPTVYRYLCNDVCFPVDEPVHTTIPIVAPTNTTDPQPAVDQTVIDPTNTTNHETTSYFTGITDSQLALDSTHTTNPDETGGSWRPYPQDCSQTAEGVIEIQPSPSSPVISVYCKNRWTVVQRRKDASGSFNRTWSEYRDGFGSVQQSHWLGLQNLHFLTKNHENGTYIKFLYRDIRTNTQMQNTFFGFKIDDELTGFRFAKGLEYFGTTYEDLSGGLFMTFDSVAGSCQCGEEALGWWCFKCDNDVGSQFPFNFNGIGNHWRYGNSLMSSSEVRIYSEMR